MKDSKRKLKERISWLRDEINRHNTAYYVYNKPSVTDFEFDLLLHELQELEKRYPELVTADSPTQKVGSDLKQDSQTNEFIRVAHKTPMLSLSNTYNKNDIIAFNERVKKNTGNHVSYVCELKIDGTAISLTYENSKLTRAVTRGDGSVGDDVTKNVKVIPGIPLEINPESGLVNFEIRGEIYMSWDSFDKLNDDRANNDEPLFANPRNAASGSLKLLDNEITKNRGLSVLFYSLSTESEVFKTHYDSLLWARNNRFPVSEHIQVFEQIQDVFEFIDKWDLKRKHLSFPIDGIVIKVNDYTTQKQTGFTSKFPRWATAYKFKAQRVSTILLSVDYQVGRTGAITPVANLEPVLLAGTVVKRASLHNKDQMDLLDIHFGDTVSVEKGGEIIPKIVNVDKIKRNASAKKILFPERCPDCGSVLQRIENEARHYCPNDSGCPMQIKGKFLHFASRKAMNILIGEATIEHMYNLGYLTDLADLYFLTREQLSEIEGWKERSVNRFMKSIEDSKDTPFTKVLYSLGIRYVGENTAKILAQSFGSLQNIKDASQEQLTEVPDVGETVASSVKAYFSDARNINTIEKLKKAGLIFEINKNPENQKTVRLKNLTFVVSGIFSISREELKSIIEQHGGKNVSSLSASTSYLVSGEKMGPAKLQKAKKLKIKILSEKEFFNLINN